MTIEQRAVIVAAIIAAAFLSVATFLADPASAADKAGLGGDCCADLEDRIAELEASTARKGNHKVSLTVSGVINQAVMFWDDNDLIGGGSDAKIGNNSVNPTRFSFAGEARFNPTWKAGFVIEVAQEDWSIVTDQLSVGTSQEVSLRQANGWIESVLGRVTLGRAAQATRGVASISVANVHDADKSLSLAPFLGGAGLTQNADLYDGQYLNLVRYDSPLLAGFMLSASWSSDGTATGTSFPVVSNVWDVALRYSKEFSNVKIAAGVGYRDGAVFPGLNPILPLPVVAFDQKTWSGSASVMHMPTGIFIDGSAGRADIGAFGPSFVFKSWEVRAGIERGFLAIGKTTLFGLYSRTTGDIFSDAIVIWGGGIVQAITPAASNLYLTVKNVDPNDNASDSAIVGTAGMAIHF